MLRERNTLIQSTNLLNVRKMFPRKKKDESIIAIKLMSATFKSIKKRKNNNSKKTNASKAR